MPDTLPQAGRGRQEGKAGQQRGRKPETGHEDDPPETPPRRSGASMDRDTRPMRKTPAERSCRPSDTWKPTSPGPGRHAAGKERKRMNVRELKTLLMDMPDHASVVVGEAGGNAAERELERLSLNREPASGTPRWANALASPGTSCRARALARRDPSAPATPLESSSDPSPGRYRQSTGPRYCTTGYSTQRSRKAAGSSISTATRTSSPTRSGSSPDRRTNAAGPRCRTMPSGASPRRCRSGSGASPAAGTASSRCPSAPGPNSPPDSCWKCFPTCLRRRRR